MINSITGVMTGKDTEYVYLENGGIEWSVRVSARTAHALPPSGREARIFTYLHHREDQMALYGFSSVEERYLFLDLLRVGGIGPKQALRILSGMSVDEFVTSLDADDVDGLSRVPGLGKKTAQKIILTLRGRLSLPPDEETPAQNAEIVAALVEMGFDRQTGTKAVERAASDVRDEGLRDEEAEKEIFRRAIVSLSSNQ
ncbi:MAG: Holliday junction branch migration protein RuvA [Spirochaetales bacterium]|nr:Holliday junction branch migration protein RuvA [Spirochaetales bacterium]